MIDRKVVMTLGLPGSGKSYWAKQIVSSDPDWKRINKDDLRSMVDAGTWSKGRETEILSIRNTLLSHFMDEGYNVIVDDTNFAPKHRSYLEHEVYRYNIQQGSHFPFKYTFEVKDFTDVPINVCINRDAARPNPVGEKVIRDMYRKYLKHKYPMHPRLQISLPWAVICDLDGTVADMKDRNPYDASTCDKDEVRIHVALTIKSLLCMGSVKHVFFFSGRENSADNSIFEKTNTWISKNVGIEGYSLHMRKCGDQRRDSIIKKEMYEQNVKGNYSVLCAFDDRPQVIKECWYELGIPVMNCGDLNAGDF